MATITSNRDAVGRALFTLAGAFNLRRRSPGGKKTLGAELIDTAAAAIEDRSVRGQQDPSGHPWARLRPRTIAHKLRKGLDPRINVATGEMLAFEQVRGQTVVTANAAAMTAGLDGETREKVGWAQEGGPNRPARPFYDLGDDGESAVDTLLGEARDRAVREAENA